MSDSANLKDFIKDISKVFGDLASIYSCPYHKPMLELKS